MRMNQANYRKTISKMHFLSFAAILLLFAATVSSVLISTYRTRYRHSIDVLRDQVIQSKKEYIRDVVLRTIQDIESDRRFYQQAGSKFQGVDADELENYLREQAKNRIRHARLKNHGYIWVDHVLNYEGGNEFAARIVHASLPDTEGLVVSTQINDGRGNYFYRDMLEGVNASGEAYFSYWFNKFGSDEIGEKISYARLYKPWDWMIATGIYLDDIDALVASEKKSAQREMRDLIKSAILITLTALLASLGVAYFFQERFGKLILFYIRKLEDNEQHLRELNDNLESKVQQRTADLKRAQTAGLIGTWVWNVEQDLWTYSGFVARMLGVDLRQKRMEELIDFVPEEDRETVRQATKHALETGEPYVAEHRIIHPEKDEVRWVLSRGEMTREQDGRPIEFCGICQDITERHRSEMAVRESERKYRDLYNSAPVALLKSSFKTKKILSANPAAVRLLGYESEQNLLENVDFSTAYVHPEDRDEWIHAVLEKGCFEKDGVLIRRKNGEEFWANLSIKSSSEAGVAELTVVDITQRKLAQLRLNHLNAVLRSIRDVNELIIQEKDTRKLIRQASRIFVRDRGFIHAWIVLLDEHNNIMDAAEASNADSDSVRSGDALIDNLPECLTEKIKGGAACSLRDREGCGSCTFSELQEEHVSLCMPLLYSEKVYGYLAAAAQEDAFQDAEENKLFREVCEDLAFALHSIELEKNRDAALKELISAKEVAENANRAKDDFLAVMSHEMRTPLNPIMGFTTLMQAANPPEPERTYLDTILQAANRQLELIDHILNFSKLDKGMPTPDLSVFNLMELCQTALRNTDVIAHNLKLSLENGDTGWAPLPPSLHVRGVRSMLLQLLDNLLNNACKYTPSGSVRLIVGVDQKRTGSARFRFCITDTGPGIPYEIRERLFEPFTQADSSYSRKHDGVGLGLAICRKLVDVLGGELGLNSEPGKGSSFWFEIPMVVIDSAGTGSRQDAALAMGRFSRPCHVLIAEDNESNILIVQRLIEKFGGTSVVARNGQEAIDGCQREPFDIILMDLAMPVMDGLTAAVKLRSSNGRNSQTPIVALTADLSSDVKERCIAAGMEHYLTKPIRYNKLFDMLEGLVTKA